MSRDVEFAITASDRTGTALAAAEAKFKASQDRIRREGDKTGDRIGKGIGDGVGKAGPGILGKFQSIFSSAGASGGHFVAAGIALAAPAIGAAVSAAIIGGAGAAGVIGGVILAARDPRVKAAGSQLGETLLGGLMEDSRSFIDPVLGSIGKIEQRFDSMRGRIANIFGNSSKFLDPLVDGALDGIEGILRGFDALVAKGGPVIREIGKSFGIIGDSIGDALEIISGGADDSADALHDFAVVIGAVIKGTAYLIRGLTELYSVISYVPNKLHAASVAGGEFLGIIDRMTGGVTKTVTSTAAAAAAIVKAGTSSTAAAGPLTSFTDKVNGLATAGRSAFDATTSVGEATDRVRAALEKNGKTLSANTAKGRENRQALSSLAGALLAQYNATVQVNGEGRESNAVAAQNRAAFAKLAGQFGLTKTEAARLASQMGLIPAETSADFYLDTNNAAGRAKAAQSAINSIKGKTVTVRVSVTGTERLDALGHRIGGYSAADLSWAATDRDSGVSRTGGATAVDVNNNISVALDGAPFYAVSIKAAQDVQSRAAWREKQGAR